MHLIACEKTNLAIPVGGVLARVCNEQAVSVLYVTIHSKEKDITFFVTLDILGFRCNLSCVTRKT